ncbi:MAG: extracellular solute-binding protein [Actinobacteria bacterium]|nr:extracellular solute-binding protein [Actinomycetota bacterium]
MKKSLVWLVVVLLCVSMVAALSLAGCKPPVEEVEEVPVEEVEEVPVEEEVAEEAAGKKFEDVTLTIQMFSGPEAEAMEPTVAYWNENYAAQTGITVINLALSRTGYFEKMQAQLMSGSADPDIVHPFSLQLGKLSMYLLPLDDYFKTELFSGPNGETYDFNDLYPAALATTKAIDGKIYMVPKDMSEVLFYWRTDLLDKAPETWPEVIEIAKEFTKTENPESPTPYGFGYQGKYEMWNFCSFLPIAWSFGAEMFDADGKPTFNTPEWVAAFKVLQDIAAFKGFQAGVENAEYPEIFATIQNGEVPVGYEWNAAYRELTSPEISPKVGGKLAIAPPAKATADGKNFMYVQTICLAINKNCKNPDAAFKFLSWASFGEGAKLYEQAGGSSPLQSIWTTSSEPLPTIAKWLEFGKPAPAYEYISDVIMIGSKKTQQVIIGELTAEEAAQAMQKEVEDFLLIR